MGKQSKAQEARERRQYMEARRREELEKQKRQNRLMWQIVICVAAIILIVSAVGVAISMGAFDRKAPTMDELDFSEVKLEDCADTEDVTDHVRMNVTYTDENGDVKTGDVVIRLYAEVAPKTVANFQKLVKSDFYDGLTFHRVYEGFMIQGGDPDGDGTGSSASIKGEMTANGFVNNLSHQRGVISMARGDSYNSGSCQFFIMHQANTNLDTNYASFGYVVYGMDTVDGIVKTEVQYAEGSIDADPTQPVNPITINYMTFVKVGE